MKISYGIFAAAFLLTLAAPCMAPQVVASASEAPQAQIEEAMEAGEYRKTRILPVAYGTVTKYQQTYRGIDVYDGEVSVSRDRDGNTLGVSGEYLPIGEVSEPALDEGQAIALLEGQYGAVLEMEPVIYKGQYAYNAVVNGGAERVILSGEGEALLELPIQSGLTMSQTDLEGNAVTLPVVQANGRYILGDDLRNIYVYDASRSSVYGGDRYTQYTDADGTFSDGMAVSVYANAIRAYDFYADGTVTGVPRFGMDDGNDNVAGNATENGEFSLRLFVHYNVGDFLYNAAFGYDSGDVGYMYVGDGTEYGALYRQGKALDVIGHEYTHGVNRFTANFEYLNDAGALDEGFADVFGSLIEGHPFSEEACWLIGEDAVPAGSVALRSLKEPSGTSRVTVADRVPPCTRWGNHANHDCDYGGVHDNSTIISHLQYRLYEEMPTYFTKEVSGKLWYATLCALNSTATFADFGEQFHAAAHLLELSDEALAVIDSCLEESGLYEAGKLHTVRYLNYDGSVLSSELVEDGGVPAAPADVPARPSSPQYDFEFTGWSVGGSKVYTDLDIYANYRRTVRYYTVTFTDAEGNPIKTERAAYGSSVTPPEGPPRESTLRYDYIFKEWSAGYNFVTGDTVLRPQYTVIEYHIVQFLVDGGVVETERALDGERVELPTPEKASTPQYDYVFEGWDRELEEITGDVTVNANFRAELRSYPVHYYSEGAEVRTETGAYGSALSLTEPEAREGYDFAGWYLDEEYSHPASTAAVQGETNLYAKWEPESSHKTFFLIALAAVLVLAIGAAVTVIVVMKH